MAEDRAGDDPAGELSQRLQPGVEVSSAIRELRVGVQLPSAAGRRQSVHGEFDLLPDRLPGEALGRAFRHGRHRQAGRGPGQADRGAGRQRPLQRRTSARSWSRTAPPRGVRLATGEVIAADIVVSNADSAWTYRYLLPPSVRSRWTDRRIERARYSMSLFVWYFGTQPQVPRTCTHHTILLGPRYKELLTDIFDAQDSAPTISACICIARPRPIRRWRRRAATRSTCCRRCRICRAAPTGRTEAESYRSAIAKRT